MSFKTRINNNEIFLMKWSYELKIYFHKCKELLLSNQCFGSCWAVLCCWGNLWRETAQCPTACPVPPTRSFAKCVHTERAAARRHASTASTRTPALSASQGTRWATVLSANWWTRVRNFPAPSVRMGSANTVWTTLCSTTRLTNALHVLNYVNTVIWMELANVARMVSSLHWMAHALNVLSTNVKDV